MSKSSTHPVSECGPGEGTQWSHPEQCPEERHHHSSQQREMHPAAKGNYQNIDRVRIHLTAAVYKVYTRTTISKYSKPNTMIYLCLGCQHIQPSYQDQKTLSTNKQTRDCRREKCINSGFPMFVYILQSTTTISTLFACF